MGKAVWIGAAVVLAAGVGLLLYQNAEQRRQQERVLAEVRAQAEASRVQMERIASQQEKIRHALGEARDTLAGANDKASLLMREDLHVVAGMRVAIAEYYASMGKMPAAHAEIGLPAPEQYRGKSLKSASLLPDGRIELMFDAQSGVDGGRVLFLPDTTHAEAMGIQWNCETPDYPLIKRALPTCDYKPADAAAHAPESALKAPQEAG